MKFNPYNQSINVDKIQDHSMLNAYENFNYELDKLISFYHATLHMYRQTELVLKYRQKHKLEYETEAPDELIVLKPEHFKNKSSSRIEIRRHLRELIFVRLISALEVYLVDTVRDIFLKTKAPFKRNDLRIDFSHSELLSLSSVTDIISKIINKECRKLSSGGYEDVAKYYRKNFNINLDSFSPGKAKIEEYHDLRHLLVHRLGRTDKQFRKKYNYQKEVISINEEYLLQSINDFKEFINLVNDQVEYFIDNQKTKTTKPKQKIERRVTIEIVFKGNEIPDYFSNDFEFWNKDELVRLSDILEDKFFYAPNRLSLTLAGSISETKSYYQLLKKNRLVQKYSIKIINDEIQFDTDGEKIKNPLLTEDLLQKVTGLLPPQPWETGIHKIVAQELQVGNKTVSTAIQILIARNVFKPQIDGVLGKREEKNHKS